MGIRWSRLSLLRPSPLLLLQASHASCPRRASLSAPSIRMRRRRSRRWRQRRRRQRSCRIGSSRQQTMRTWTSMSRAHQPADHRQCAGRRPCWSGRSRRLLPPSWRRIQAARMQVPSLRCRRAGLCSDAGLKPDPPAWLHRRWLRRVWTPRLVVAVAAESTTKPQPPAAATIIHRSAARRARTR